MNAITCQCVEEYRKGCNEGLTFTGGHLSNLTLVESDASEYLYIVVHHIPFDLIATGSPFIMVDGIVSIDGDEVVGGIGCKFAVEVGCGNNDFLVLGKTAGRILHNAVGYVHHLVESFLQSIKHLLILLVNLVEDGLAFIDRSIFNLTLKLGNFVKIRLGCILNILLDFLALGTQFVVAQFLNFRICILNFLNQRLNQLHISA